MPGTEVISVRDHMVAQAAAGQPFFSTLKALGVNAIELELDPALNAPHIRQTDGKPFSLATDAHLVAFRTLLAGEGAVATSLLLETDFSSGQSADSVSWTVNAVRVADALGAPVVRVDALARDKTLTLEQVRDNFVSAMKQVLNATSASKVALAMENHGPIGNQPEFIETVFAAVGSDRLGQTLDTANFYWWGVPLDELYALLARFAPKARHTHIKSINYPAELASVQRPIGLDYGKYCCGLAEGNIDLRRVVKILRDAGYAGDYCIENESLTKAPEPLRLALLKKDVAALEDAMA